MPKAVLEEVERQLKKLERMHPDAAETATLRNYLDWMVTLPWSKSTQGQPRPERGRRRSWTRTTTAWTRSRSGSSSTWRCASSSRTRRARSSASSGPPGVGKTSLGRSIARALGRKFVRLSLGRRPGRGGDPRPPPDLRRRHARAASSRASSRRAPTTRSSCWTRWTSRRATSGAIPLGAARGARPGAEQRLPRPLPRRALRPVQGHVHHHGQPDRHHPARLPGPDGGHPAPGLHRGREAADRQAAPGAQAARGARPRRRAAHLHRRGAARSSSTATPARRACGTSSGRSPPSAARWRARSPRATTGDDPRHRHRSLQKYLGPPKITPRGDRLKKDADRGRHRAGLDRRRRRHPLHRGHHDEGQGAA